jgi:hypothetical protein
MNQIERQALLGLSWLKRVLTHLLQSRLISHQDLHRELFRASGPLGAFSVKINVAFLLNLFTETARRELETIKEIRNEFAHRIARSFSFERIRDLANNLSISERWSFMLFPK